MNRGRFLIVLMLIASLAVAAGGIVFYRNLSDRVVREFSPRVAALISRAQRVELLRLASESQAATGAKPDEVIRVQGTSLWVVGRKDVSAAQDIDKVRSWLMHNDNYDWDQPAPKEPTSWQYALVFTEGPEQTKLLFNIPQALVLLLPEGKTVSTRPMNQGLQKFFTSELPATKE